MKSSSRVCSPRSKLSLSKLESRLIQQSSGRCLFRTSSSLVGVAALQPPFAPSNAVRRVISGDGADWIDLRRKEKEKNAYFASVASERKKWEKNSAGANRYNENGGGGFGRMAKGSKWSNRTRNPIKATKKAATCWMKWSSSGPITAVRSHFASWRPDDDDDDWITSVFDDLYLHQPDSGFLLDLILPAAYKLKLLSL